MAQIEKPQRQNQYRAQKQRYSEKVKHFGKRERPLRFSDAMPQPGVFDPQEIWVEAVPHSSDYKK